MAGRVKILDTYPKSEEIISFYHFSRICGHYTVLAITSSRTAMFWLCHFISSISIKWKENIGTKSEI